MDEYIAMFELTEMDLSSKILSCADGPSSFNAEMYLRGRIVTSIDPIYRFSAKDIQSRIDTVYPTVMEQLKQNTDDYIWTDFHSPEALGQKRLETMNKFLKDFPEGIKEKRYISDSLPNLPFKDRTFDLALCSHFLFLYSKQLTTDFHRESIYEMLRVAKEVRIFPLLTLNRQPSQHLESICEDLDEFGFNNKIRIVNYEFQIGGNQMLMIWRN